jgi:hypothetical protein
MFIRTLKLGNVLSFREADGLNGADQVFWMVELMESWFLAHPQALATYYGKGFHSKALGDSPQIRSTKSPEGSDQRHNQGRFTTRSNTLPTCWNF